MARASEAFTPCLIIGRRALLSRVMVTPPASSHPAEPAAPVFRLDAAAKTYGALTALKPLSVDLAAGQTTAFIGPSGSGKSTIVKLLAGLLAPSTGRVLFHGQDVAALDPVAYRRRLGYVIQEGGLFPHMTGRQNVTLVAREAGWSRAAIGERLDTLARSVHMPADRLDRYPGELSGGQCQRIGIMRALMLDPEVLLFDEPFSALDPIIRYDLQSEVRDIIDSFGKTAVLVTHDLAEARFLSHHIHLMRAGRVVQSGSYDDLAAHPADGFVAKFFAAHRGLAPEPGEPG